MAIVREFEFGRANMARLNSAMIILIPKEDEAKSLKKMIFTESYTTMRK
jgi:hypothetical protein